MWLGTLERNIVWEDAQRRVNKYFVILFQEGIEKVRERTRETHSEVL